MANDLIGVGQITEKVLETVSKAVGVLYEPRRIRLEAKARAEGNAYEVEMAAKSAAKVADILSEAEAAIQKRAIQRIRSVELFRQKNIDRVLEDAISLIENSATKSAKPADVSVDWMARFLECAKEVSDEHVLKIWAEILAGKAVQGRRGVSLMTLDGLRLMERPHAILFTEIARRVAAFRTCFPFLTPKPAEAQYGGHNAIHALVEMGFLHSRDLNRDASQMGFPFPSFHLQLSATPERGQRIPEWGLTFRGHELASVILRDDNLIPYWEDFKSPDPTTRFRHLPLHEQSGTLRHWFNILTNPGGYKVQISISPEGAAAVKFAWKGRLIPPKNFKGVALVPPELLPLLDENS